MTQSHIDFAPWAANIYIGNNTFTKGSPSSTLESKLCLEFHVLEKEIGTLQGKRILDIGSNNGYMLAEGIIRGAKMVGIEPFDDNRKKCEFIKSKIDINNNMEIHNMLMEETTYNKLGSFDAILFLGTIYHTLEPWKVLENFSEMTDVIIIESQTARLNEVNDTVGNYKFKKQEEGPGSKYDDPAKNYLRQVLSGDIRIPTEHTLVQMLEDVGFTCIQKIYPVNTPEGKLSNLYQEGGKGVIMIATKNNIKTTKFNKNWF